MEMHVDAVYRRERDPFAEYRYSIDIQAGAPAKWTASIWRADDYLGSLSGKIEAPPLDQVLLQTLVEAEVRDIIETRYSLF